MKHIDICDLPNLTADDLGEGEAYTVRRDGDVLGYFVPKHREDPEKKRREAEAFRRKLAEYRANGWLDTEILDNLDRAFAENGSSSGPVTTTQGSVPGLTIRDIDVRQLPGRSSDEIRTGPTYTVERDGEEMGLFLPRKKKDPKAMQAAWDALDRTIDSMLRNGYTREQLIEDFDLSKPFRHDL